MCVVDREQRQFVKWSVSRKRLRTTAVHCQWEDEMMGKRTRNTRSYAKAKKMNSPTLHSHGCLRGSLINCSSSFNWTISQMLFTIISS